MNAAVTPANLGSIVDGAGNSKAVAPASAQAKRDAEMAGAQAFLEGKRTYPHELDRDTALFRAWCRGYREARRQHEAMYGEIV